MSLFLAVQTGSQDITKQMHTKIRATHSNTLTVKGLEGVLHVLA
jgi:hypothetical protein